MINYAQKMHKCSEYVEALEVERRKIQVFQRELPLCFELVSQAIDACRQQLSSPAAAGTSHECFTVRRHQQSECSEQTSRSSHGPVLEEFIPIKKIDSCSSEDGNGGGGDEEEEEDEKSCKKSDWLRSVQLWNQSPDPADPVSELKKKNGGAFSPFLKEKVAVENKEVVGRRLVEDKPASSTTARSRKEEGNKDKDSAQATQRKQRRCWSPELHRRFIHSLQQLGGPHVATPKQIKELMKVDGLTNDEVKSHLQKYRLHMRRPSATMAASSNTQGQGPQYLVVGGIWVPPPDCPAAGATAVTVTSSADQGEANSLRKKNKTPSNGVYAPVATIGTPFAGPSFRIQNKSEKDHSRSHCEDAGSHSAHGGALGGRSSSPTSSSSTHTTAVATVSPCSS